MQKQEIVIWGTGKLARQFFYERGYKYDIKYFIDNFEPKYKMSDLLVYFPKEVDLGQYKIIIAVADWKSIAEQLENEGYHFYKNYMPYSLLDKDEIPIIDILTRIMSQKDREDIIRDYKGNRKLALINGNCQTSRIKQFLKQNKDFNKEYIFVDLPEIYLLNKNEIELLISSNVLKKIQLFISQNISLNNNFDYRLSNQYLISLMDENVRYVRIPNLYFDVYFPNGGKEQDQKKAIFIRDMFPYNDAIIDELQKCKGFTGGGYSMDEIVQIINIEDLFSCNLLHWIVKYRLEQLKERERECDIKMTDYIEKFYLEKQLFYSRNHPINDVLKEESIRILRYIDARWSIKFEHEETIPSLSINQEFIFPSVANGLELKFLKKYYSDGISQCKYTMEDEAKKYIFCHGNKYVNKELKN